jgi:hypothetical protein
MARLRRGGFDARSLDWYAKNGRRAMHILEAGHRIAARLRIASATKASVQDISKRDFAGVRIFRAF